MQIKLSGLIEMDFPTLTKTQWIYVALGLPVFVTMTFYGFYLLLSPWHLSPIQYIQSAIILFTSGAILGTMPIWLRRFLVDIEVMKENEGDEDE